MKKLQDFIENHEKTYCLPFVHTARFEKFEQIINDMKLIPADCPNLENKYLYLFYGRAAYVPVLKNKKENTSLHDTLPIAFIIKPNNNILSRTFPFDSGAFVNELYEKVFDSKFDIEMFELDAYLNNLDDYITTFFGTVENYLYGESNYNDNHGPFELLHESFKILISDKTKTDYDERCKTIELISQKELFLKNHTLFVIIPTQLLSDENVLTFVDEIGAEVEAYVATSPHNIRDIVGKVKALTEKIIFTNSLKDCSYEL